ncbi:hypothetical protein IFT64_13505 [Oxalobacteraceae sp. CFBP 8753]|nr:hypothetical protein [Oxalobacteraceae sp. CFBP 8753]
MRYIQVHRSRWKNAKNANRWLNSFVTSVSSLTGTFLFVKINTGLGVTVLSRISRKNLRPRPDCVDVSRIFFTGSFAQVLLRWKTSTMMGHRNFALANPKKSRLMKNYPVLARDMTGEFMHSAKLREGLALHINAVNQLRRNAVNSPAFAHWGGAGLAL